MITIIKIIQADTKAKAPAKPGAKKAIAKTVAAPVSTGDPLADKLREQRLVEESDYQNTRDILCEFHAKTNTIEETKA